MPHRDHLARVDPPSRALRSQALFEAGGQQARGPDLAEARDQVTALRRRRSRCGDRAQVILDDSGLVAPVVEQRPGIAGQQRLGRGLVVRAELPEPGFVTPVVPFGEEDEAQQRIGGAAHRRNDDAEPAVRQASRDIGDNVRNAFVARGVSQAAPAEFMDSPPARRHAAPRCAKRLMITDASVLFRKFQVVGRVGIEPTTSRLKAECSTSELTPPVL